MTMLLYFIIAVVMHEVTSAATQYMLVHGIVGPYIHASLL